MTARLRVESTLEVPKSRSPKVKKIRIMKIKDNFWLGLLAGAASFGLFFFLLSLIPWGEQYGRAPYLLAFIPGIILFRMLLVKWNCERIGKGILLVTVIGMLLVFFLYKV